MGQAKSQWLILGLDQHMVDGVGGLVDQSEI